MQNDNPIESHEYAPDAATDTPTDTEQDTGWGVEAAPTFAMSASLAALRSRAPEADTARAAEPLDPDPQGPTETRAEVVDHVIDEVYDAWSPAMESAAEMELLANAMPELGSPEPELPESDYIEVDQVESEAPEVSAFHEPAIPLGSTEPLTEEAPQVAGSTNAVPSENAYRLAALTRKIEQFPEAPANYVLRGELYLAIRDAQSARNDFEMAIQLTETHDPDLDWGYVNSALLDRAYEHLQRLIHS